MRRLVLPGIARAILGGVIMSFGKGAAMSLSKKQELNARSSTESELIGIDDAILSIMWLLYFIKAQGYDVTHNHPVLGQ